MIQKMFTIRDAKAESFHNPFFQLSHGEAERSFRTAVNDEKTQLHKYPEDFDLYYLGEFDTNNGTFQSLDTPQHVIKAVQCIKQKPA